MEVPVTIESTKEQTKMESDEITTDTTSGAGETDGNMQDAKASPDGSDSRAENGLPEAENKPVKMETDTKVFNMLCEW